MRGRANSTGVEMFGKKSLVSKGEHVAIIEEISEKITRNDDPMFSIKLMIIDGLEKGLWVYDNIVIPKLGSPSFVIMGRTIHFLSCIGEPFEGEFEFDSDNWLNKKVTINVDHENPNAHHDYVKAYVKGYKKYERKDMEAPF